MMGHRERLIDGAEQDALTRWKNVYHWRPGVRKWIKRKVNRRARAKAKRQVQVAEWG